jgi:predicted ABC-type ATPase
MPKLYIIAGPNGAGKTTFAKEFLPKYAKCSNFINADLIALGLSPFSPSAVSIKAGKLLLGQIKEFVEQRKDFAFESTLAGRTYISLINEMRNKGYSVTIFFLWVPDVRLARERIKQRVKDGGHDVPYKDVKRRFERSRSNFLEYYEPLSDSWLLFDNSGGKPEEIGQMTNKCVKILNKGFYNSFIGGNNDKSKR